MGKWQCDDCGEVHRSNPRRCKNCGNSVLSPYRGDGAADEGWRKWIPFL